MNDGSWNHNSHHHRWLLGQLPLREQGWRDHVRRAAGLVAARALDTLHGGAHDPGVPLRDPELSWAGTRAAFARVLPGTVFRRAVLWRYTARWQRPG